MNSSMYRLAIVCTTAMLALASQLAAQVQEPDGDRSSILHADAYLARNASLAGFSVKSAYRQDLDVIGTYIDHIQLFNFETAEHRKLILTEADTLLTDPASIYGRVEAATRASFGNLSPEVHAKAAASPPEELLRLKLWGATPQVDMEKPTVFDDGADVDAFMLRHREALLEATARITSEMAEEISPFARIVGTLEHFPVLLVDIAAEDIPSLQQSGSVQRAEFRVTEDTPRELHSAGYTSFYDADDAEAAETWAASRHGRGVRTGVLENARYCGIWDGHPAFTDLGGYSEMAAAGLGENGCTGLADGTLCPTNCSDDVGYCRSGRCYKDHAMMVASKLGSVRGTEVRNASEMALFFANSGTDEERLDWFVDNGVTMVNHSYGNQGAAMIADMDYMIRNDYITVTKSSGNSQAEEADCYPNSICVGSYSIVDPANVDNWKADPENNSGKYQRSGSTSFINASTYPDAEKPDVVGNGEASLVSAMASARTTLWDTSSFGTSFAAPMVGGMVAVLQEELPLTKVWPEVVRPMIMVSARMHNIEGARLSRNDAGGDEWDGAGVPTASALRLIVSNKNFELLSLVPRDFDANGDVEVTSLFLGQGRTARVVAGWMYCSDGGKSFLATDLDLYLIDSAHDTLADVSASATNSLEMLEYQNNGTARRFSVKLRRFGKMQACAGKQQEYVGVAWSVY